LGARLADAAFVDDLKTLAQADLELDTANPDTALIRDVVRLTDKVPELRVVIDHLPSLQPPGDAASRAKYEADLSELGKRPRVYAKISAVLRQTDGRVAHELASYRPTLDHLWEIFGEDRLIYGSDWPNSDPLGSYAQVLGIVQSYFYGKGHAAAEKYFWKNSVAAYRWKPRNSKQPRMTARAL
jgi:predicted TIM-barrel fold metal-dependent hydrolase